MNGHGKNFEALVASGAWVIHGFIYGSSRCGCCGRPIARILKLKNLSHEAACSHDPEYKFPEIIEIGVVCGPKVFQESCVGFYDNPAREWERQYQLWKTYIKYVLACQFHGHVWEHVPAQLTTAVDAYLMQDLTNEPHSGNWWMLRDAKRLLLERTKCDAEEKPIRWSLAYRIRDLMACARRLNVIPREWRLTSELKICTDSY